MSEIPKPLNKADRNKIIFLTISIVALLGSNAYLYFRDKHENNRYVTANTEKDRMKLEVEKIEVELDKINSINITLNEKLIKEQDLARQQIAELKARLQKGQLTQGELVAAQKQITELKEYIYNYNQEISRLSKENNNLKTERDSLVKSVRTFKDEAELLAETNANLNAKIVTGAALKTSRIEIKAFKVKHSGKNVLVTHASSAKKDYHKIYLRIFDPAGNLIADEHNMFEADGQEMQYTEMITISYNNDETEYEMEWQNPAGFKKGAYAVILYADGYVMGKSSITLK
jgi:predicted  nucleic acid-binding Zn-ribbon protein